MGWMGSLPSLNFWLWMWVCVLVVNWRLKSNFSLPSDHCKRLITWKIRTAWNQSHRLLASIDKISILLSLVRKRTLFEGKCISWHKDEANLFMHLHNIMFLCTHQPHFQATWTGLGMKLHIPASYPGHMDWSWNETTYTSLIPRPHGLALEWGYILNTNIPALGLHSHSARWPSCLGGCSY